MTEPRRILEDKGRGLEVELLRAARAYRPAPTAKRSVLAALGLPTAAAAALTTSKVAAALGTLKALAATKAGTVALVIAGVAAVGAGTGYLVETRPTRLHAHDTSPLREAAPPVVAPPVAPRISAAAEPSAGAAEPEPPPPDARPAPRAPVPTAAPPRVSSAEPPADGDTLAGELSSLDRVRAAQQAHEPSRALAELDAYAARYPHGNLGMEAAVLRIEIYAASGDYPTSRRLANQFLSAHPRNLLANRVRALRASWPSDPAGDDRP